MEYGILTTRFTDETFLENIRWRQRNNDRGCIYAVKKPVSHILNYDKDYFILEMNNDKNVVMGVGIITIKLKQRNEQIYNNPYYNRYIYSGTHYKCIYENDDYIIDKKDTFIELFETPLFRGKGHMKRGQSITHYPFKKMTKTHIDFLKTLFDI